MKMWEGFLSIKAVQMNTFLSFPRSLKKKNQKLPWIAENMQKELEFSFHLERVLVTPSKRMFHTDKTMFCGFFVTAQFIVQSQNFVLFLILLCTLFKKGRECYLWRFPQMLGFTWKL